MNILLICWVSCGVLSAMVASNKNRNAFAWLIIGFLTGFIGLAFICGTSEAKKKPDGLRDYASQGFGVHGFEVEDLKQELNELIDANRIKAIKNPAVDSVWSAMRSGQKVDAESLKMAIDYMKAD